MYQLNGEEELFAWLATNPDDLEAVLAWLPELARQPHELAAARRLRPGVPAYVARIPGTEAFVDYTVVEEYRTVLILSVSSPDVQNT